MKACPASVSFRPAQAADVPALVELYLRVFEPLQPLYSYPLEAQVFRDKVLDHPDYDPAGAVVAEEDGRMIGYLLAGARTHPWSKKDPLAGCMICLLMVDAAHRRRGIGHALLERARAFARAKGKDLLTNHANPASPFSFFNGVQEDWRAARAFFEAEGFAEVEVSCTCRQNLAGFETSDEAQAKRAALEAEGYTIEPCGERCADALLEAAASHYFYWHWDCASKVRRIDFPFLETAFLSLRRENIYGPDDVIVAQRNGRVDSYVVMARNPGGPLAYLGPMWTRPDCQRKGFGTVVLQEALRREKEIHAVRVVDLWCSEPNAQGFYARNGFQIVGRWHEFEQRV